MPALQLPLLRAAFPNFQLTSLSPHTLVTGYRGCGTSRQVYSNMPALWLSYPRPFFCYFFSFEFSTSLFTHTLRKRHRTHACIHDTGMCPVCHILCAMILCAMILCAMIRACVQCAMILCAMILCAMILCAMIRACVACLFLSAMIQDTCPYHGTRTCPYAQYGHVSCTKPALPYCGLMDESWHTYGWVMAHIWMSHGTHMKYSTLTRGMFHKPAVWHSYALHFFCFFYLSAHARYMVSRLCCNEARTKQHARITSCFITGWRKLIGCLKLQVIFRKRAPTHRNPLRKMTYKDKTSYGSSSPCTRGLFLFLGNSDMPDVVQWSKETAACYGPSRDHTARRCFLTGVALFSNYIFSKGHA